MLQPLKLSAPSRLHFGLFSVGQAVEYEFGGVGLMIEQPRTTIEVTAARKFSITGPSAHDARVAIEKWFESARVWLDETDDLRDFVQSISSLDQLPLKITIQSLPPRHGGLGSGTQLALGSVVSIIRFLKLPVPSPAELSAVVGRGRRSAIGTYGFFAGGLLVDRGKSADEAIAPLDFRVDFPDDWPVLIFLQREQPKVFGTAEMDAFERLAPTTELERERLVTLVREQLLPGVVRQDYDQFAEAVYQFGRGSGLHFASVQGGPYNGQSITDLVSSIRESGVAAVGQTSWGPSVFAIAPDQATAERVQYEIDEKWPNRFECLITRADNDGAVY